MRKHIFIKSLSILSLAVLVTSCEKYLDLQPISEETTINGFATAGQLEAGLTGVYESFQSSDYHIWDNVLFQDVRTDNHYAGGDNPEIFAIDNNNITPVNSRVFNAWSTLYNAIAKANLVLERAPLLEDPALSENRRSEIMGEAYFLRAYNYYNLVKMWGGVPITLELISSTDPSEIRLPRASAEEVYNQIVTDLNTALPLLPHTYSGGASETKARATKGAANALLAKVYAQRPNKNYGLVLEYANAVISSPANYTLMPEYEQLFDGNNYNNMESILEVQFLGGNEGNWAPQMHLPPSISGDAWRKFTTPSHDLIDAFDAQGDEIRKNATVMFETVDWVDEYWGNSPGSSIPFAYKWKNASGFASADRQYIFRLADIILLKAEALNEQGNPADAAVEVNKIRERANLPDLTDEQTASVESMRDAILLERRLELAQEAQRWDDLRRYGVAIETMNNLEEIDLRTGNIVDYNFEEKDLLLPIPQQEINRNPNLTQNPGY